MTGSGSRRFAFGGGEVVIADDGSVVAVEHPDGRPMLLAEPADGVEARMHTAARRWGKGFVITDGRGRRFDSPADLTWREVGVTAAYDCGPLALQVERRVGEAWSETYELHNRSGAPVAVGSLAVSTPWRDVYESSRDSLTRAVHAHLWTGGADSWVWAVPMDGTAPGLGLEVTEGELWAYSVESRDQFTGSNVRGHLYLHVTDHHRSPHTFGGQPELTLRPGDRYRLAWSLRWHPSLTDFGGSRTSWAQIGTVAADLAEPIEIELADDVSTDTPLPVRATEPGLRYVDLRRGDGRRSRIGCLFHLPLRELAERRAEFLLDRQRPGSVPTAAGMPSSPSTTRRS